MKHIRHSWEKLTDTGKKDHARCRNKNCGLEKWWDFNFGILIYMDLQGCTYYRAPECKINLN